MTSTPANTTSSRQADADTSRFHAAPLRNRGRHSTADRILSAGLATAACIGVVGVLGARSMESGAAAQQDTAASAGTATLAVSSTGLTEQQLDAYAAQLQAEGAKLDAYRAQLATVAASLKSGSSAGTTASTASVASSVPTVRKPKPKPKPKAAPAPAPSKPQSTTKSS